MSELIIQNEDELKLKFAAAMLRFPNDPFKAGLEVFGTDTGRALYVASHWINDPLVCAEKQRILDDDGEMFGLPSKAEVARKVWDLATAERPMEDKDRLEMLKFYSSLRGFIEKPKDAAGEGTTNIQANNVMIVRDHGTNEQWAEKLRRQQEVLIENAAKPVAH
jgi:hypothetical protein